MDGWQRDGVGLDRAGWLLNPDQFRSSTLIFLALAGLTLLLGVLFWFGVINRVLGLAGTMIRGAIRTGFTTWERLLAWAAWPFFLAIELCLITLGVFAVESLPWMAVAIAVSALGLGLAACLGYMFIDVERYQVVRGYKALHDPLKGQQLAVELSRYGGQLGLPMLGAAATGMIGGFALLNDALFSVFGRAWYSPPADDATYFDFLASALVHLLSVVDLLNVANNHRLARLTVARPVAPLASFLLMVFKSFFTLVLLQQIFASVRKGRLLTETIADFWSPHEPIHERARAVLPQYGTGALGPLLLSLRTTETLTREQRDQLPRILATIGPGAIPALIDHLGDSSEHVRAVAAATLGRLRATAALSRLVRLVKDPSDLVRLSLVEALGEIGAGLKGAATPARAGEQSMWRRLRGRAPSAPPRDPIAIAIDALLLGLADAAAAVRAESACALGRLGTAAAASLPELTRLLDDPDETVQSRAAESLGQVGVADPQTPLALAKLLEAPSPAIRAAAARALGMLQKAAAPVVHALAPLLQDRDDGVRQAAADAVGRIGVICEAAAEILTEGLASDDNVVRARTAEALGGIGEAAADVAPALVEAASDDNDRVRAKAIEALGKIGEAAAEVAVPRLVRALKDPDNWVSALAAEALGEMGAGADEAIPALARSLRHSNPEVRANSAEALGKLGSAAAAAIPALERAGEDENEGVRLAVVRALGVIGLPTPESLRLVRSALAAPAPQTRAAAAEAFGAWGEADEAARADLLGLLDDANDEVKVRAARVLPKLAGATPEVIDGLTRRLAEDDSDWVRVESARALGQLGASAMPAGEALLRAAQTGDGGLREEAMRALIMIQPPEAPEAFMTGLRDADAQVRMLASAGWRKAAIVPEEAVPALVEALQDPEVQVRANAAHALSRLDPVPAESIPYLAAGVTHSDPGLRLNAALALQAVPGRASSDALHPLLEDPNPRLRLIAARRVLAEDPVDTTAVAVVAEALVAPAAALRKAATELVATAPLAAAAILPVLQARPPRETDSADVPTYVAEAVESLQSLAEGQSNDQPQNTHCIPNESENANKSPGSIAPSRLESKTMS